MTESINLHKAQRSNSKRIKPPSLSLNSRGTVSCYQGYFFGTNYVWPSFSPFFVPSLSVVTILFLSVSFLPLFLLSFLPLLFFFPPFFLFFLSLLTLSLFLSVVPDLTLKRKGKAQLVDCSCSCVLNPPSLCSPLFDYITSELGVTMVTVFQPFPLKSIPPALRETTCKVAI